jgi:hypothetical protein
MSITQASMLSWAGDLKSFILSGFQTLPLALGGTFLMLSLFTANYAMLFVTFGMLVVTPILQFPINIAAEFVGEMTGLSSVFGVNKSDLCDLIQQFPVSLSSVKSGYSGISLWLAMMSFIMGYILTNAIALLQYTSDIPSDATADVKKEMDSGINNRMVHAYVSIIMIIILYIVIIAQRFMSGCESKFGISIGAALFSVLGFLWYILLSWKTGGRLADLFGIANRLLRPGAMNNEPVACLPYAGTK